MISLGRNTFHITSCKQPCIILKIVKLKTPVQIALESNDFNMEFHSSDNGVKQLCTHSKTCVKRPLKNRQNKGLNDKW